ncbi:MAG: hypothetical protein KDA41_13330, partial [Planctomycetales bacterium]|nr:hypothetical protein [Planctomycetales bacterium]
MSNNRANRAGGAIEDAGGFGSSVALTNVDLTGNNAGVAPATAAPGNGGAIHITGAGEVSLSGGSVTNNTAANEGGGLWNSSLGGITIDGTTISDNTAAVGGGVFNDAAADDVRTFTVDLSTLNAAFGSTATGTATITLDTSGVTGPSSGTADIRVQMHVTGLQDLSGINGAVHVAHIHGQFAGNANRPLAAQGDGPFFDGEGGAANGFPPIDSILPSAADDGDKNVDETAMFGTASDYLDFFEGRPDYGPVVLNLTADQLESAPDGTPPLTFFFQQAGMGNVDPAAQFPSGTTFTRDTTYTFDLSDPDERRQFNNLTPLEAREIVVHGLTIPTEISDAIDEATGAQPGSPTAGVPLGNGMSFRATAPVAAGEIAATGGGSVTIENSTIANNT